MATPSFSSILDRQSTEIERPKPIPIGTYLAVVKGQPRMDKSSKKQTPFVEFTLAIVQASDDIDEDSLKAYLTRADGSSKSLQEQSIRATYYLTEDAAWRLTKFLDDCGTDAEQTVGQRVNEAINCQVWANIKHEPSEDGESIFARLSGTAKVD